MEVDELIMMSDNQIDYSSLSSDTLKTLALGDELFIATSAITELVNRKSSIAGTVAWEILSKSDGDCYLQAAALSILFNLNREQALDYIIKQAQYCNPYILNSIMELMIENESDFKSGHALSFVRIVSGRLKKFDESAKFPEPEVRHSFLKLYGNVENIQEADAVTLG